MHIRDPTSTQVRGDLDSLSETVQIFEDSHRAIVRGVGSVKGISQLTEVCTLSAMEYVDGRWTYLRPSHMSNNWSFKYNL